MSNRPTGFCDHCGLPLGYGRHQGEREGEAGQFCCYGCFIGWQAARGGGDDVVAAAFLIRLGLGAFLAMNIMLFSLLLYSEALDGIDGWLKPYFHGLLWVLATPVLVILGGPFFKEAFEAARRARLVSSILVVIGTSAAYTYSAIVTLEGGDRVYFDAVAIVLVLFTLGRYLEADGRARAARSLRPMMEAERLEVRCVEDGLEIFRPLADIETGMLVRIEPGERIGVDGVVREGVSQAEESSITGEPWPLPKNPGASVLAGSINGDGTLLVETSVAGLASRWIAICRDVRAALSRPTRAQKLAEMVAGAFIPLVIALAAGTIWVGWQNGAGEAALMSGLAVLVVACPCALGLATPLATSVAIARLAEAGILVRSGVVLETLANIRIMALDKTGTLTAGRCKCRDVIVDNVDPDNALERAASLATTSEHPLSKAICRAAHDQDIDILPISNVEIVPGMGVRGVMDGDVMLLGSDRWLEREGIRISDKLRAKALVAAEKGQMVSMIAWQGVARSLLTFDDARHPDAETLISTLERDGIQAIILTGDGALQTERFCRLIGATEWSAELMPEDKRDKLAHLASGGRPLAMVGDGANDALALTTASVGIAVGGATELTRETADVVLPPVGITALPELLRIARLARQTIRTNLLWAFGYNSIALVLAMIGILQPVVAAALMAGSSLFVVVNTITRLGPNHRSSGNSKPLIYHQNAAS